MIWNFVMESGRDYRVSFIVLNGAADTHDRRGEKYFRNIKISRTAATTRPNWNWRIKLNFKVDFALFPSTIAMMFVCEYREQIAKFSSKLGAFEKTYTKGGEIAFLKQSSKPLKSKFSYANSRWRGRLERSGERSRERPAIANDQEGTRSISPSSQDDPVYRFRRTRPERGIVGWARETQLRSTRSTKTRGKQQRQGKSRRLLGYFHFRRRTVSEARRIRVKDVVAGGDG